MKIKNETKPTSSTSETPKIKSALLDKYEDTDKKEIEGYERLKSKENTKNPISLNFLEAKYIFL